MKGYSDTTASLCLSLKKSRIPLRLFNAGERNPILDNSVPDWSCGILFLRAERALSTNPMQSPEEDRETVMNLFAICGRFGLFFSTIPCSIKCEMNIRIAHRSSCVLSENKTLRFC